MSQLSDFSLGLKHLQRITDRQFRLIEQRFGENVTIRKRKPTVVGGEVCPCIDEIFHQIKPNCELCGGTGIVNGQSFRDNTARVLFQPARPFGFMGSSVTYGYTTKTERALEVMFARGSVDIDNADFIIRSRRQAGAIKTIEYEVFDKEPWTLSAGITSIPTVVIHKFMVRKTPYAKTVDEVVDY